MAQGDAASTHLFGLQLGSVEAVIAQEVSGLTIQLDVTEQPMVTEDGKFIIRKQPGKRQAGEVTITRVLNESPAFYDWVKLVLMDGNIEKARQNVTIEVKTADGKTVRRINLVNAWVSKWEPASLSAGQSGAATEKATITYEDIEVKQ
ncbi:phage tail protein [Amycolatopsis sp. CA-230715]|uniref:phage tail protein n=1 Tax=Amycolatopsis sp. CA-230715 TaxID=2745196 RepID=UPI001C027A98|nr:phage tail protein [Amycolatopsis sp. CA-230715]QWF77834.1 hypothetical protein HUW46_01227 [Amycolatopsis sp. CA-230715]